MCDFSLSKNTFWFLNYTKKKITTKILILIGILVYKYIICANREV